MKVTITDKEAIAALSWEALRAYMDASDWHHADDITGKAAVYQHHDETGRLWEILVPLRRDLGDYVSRMGDAITILARIEDRSELDVYEDLRALGAQSPQVDDATRAVHENIRRWLSEEGWTIEDIPNPNGILNLSATLSDGQRVRLIQMKSHGDQIVIASPLPLGDVDQSSLAHVSPADLDDLIWNLHRDATLTGVDLEGLEPPLRTIWHIASVYFDGLTKDTLFQRIQQVRRAISLSVHTLARGLQHAERPVAAADLRRHAPASPLTDFLSAAS